MNFSVHSPVPYHSQYPKSTAANMTRKNDNKDTSLNFKDILHEKMKPHRSRQASVPNRTTVARHV